MMTNQHESEINSNETRNMWIAVAVIVGLLLGGMGINILVHHDTSTDDVETHSPSQ